jgi:hypothetical protein
MSTSIARDDGSYASELGRISRFDVLVSTTSSSPMKDTERRSTIGGERRWRSRNVRATRESKKTRKEEL